MFSRAIAMFRSNHFTIRLSPSLCQESHEQRCQGHSFDECVYLRTIAKELSNVAADLYAEGDHTTALDLYRDAIDAISIVVDSDENDNMFFDDEIRSRLIARIIQGKQQLHQMTLPSQLRVGGIGSYQWSASESNASPRFLSEAMKIERDQGQHSDNDPIIVATIMSNTGLILMKDGNLDGARALFGLALKGIESMRLNDTYDSALSTLVVSHLLNNIGCIQYIQGSITNAKKTFLSALRIGNNVLKQTSRINKSKIIQGYKHVGTIYYNLGIANARLDLKEETKKSLECAVALQKEGLGESHPDNAIVQHNVGLIFLSAGLMNEAMNALLESIRIIRFVFGNGNRQVAKVLFQLGKVHEMKCEYNEALHVYQETLRIERLTLGMNHPEAVMTMYEIGKVHHERGDLEEALNTYNEILPIVWASSSIGTLSLVLLLCQMVTIHIEIGNIEAATRIYIRVSRMIEQDSSAQTIINIVAVGKIEYLLMNPPAAATA